MKFLKLYSLLNFIITEKIKSLEANYPPIFVQSFLHVESHKLEINSQLILNAFIRFRVLIQTQVQLSPTRFYERLYWHQRRKSVLCALITYRCSRIKIIIFIHLWKAEKNIGKFLEILDIDFKAISILKIAFQIIIDGRNFFNSFLFILFILV